MESKIYDVKLSLKELLSLDGNVSESVQNKINQIKKEQSYGFELPIMNEILRKSEETGNLTWKYKPIRECNYCDKKYDYYRYPRSGKYHNKGDKNINKPIYYSGIAFNEGFITISGRGDMCTDCEKKYNVIHKLVDYIIENDLKIEIQNNDYRPSKYLKDKIKICYNCDRKIKESEMVNVPTVMGDGYYKGICPHCNAKELPFGKSHRITNKFDVTANPNFKEEVQNIKALVKEHNKRIENDKDKIRIIQNKNNNKIFIIEETEWENGYRTVIKFNVEKKIFSVGYFWKNELKTLDFINELMEHEYKEKGE